jgi:hypothetical protein
MATAGMSTRAMSTVTLSLTKTSPQNRLLMWVLLLLLTAALLLYPVNVVFEYQPIQGPGIFDNLPLFAGILVVWALLLLLMLFTREDQGETVDWQTAGLACVFGLVFIGFWVVITPFGSYSDDMYNMGIVRWLVQHGSIAIGSESLPYFEFPGMHLLVSAICMSAGLGVFEGRPLFLLFNAALFSGLFYLFTVRVLKSNRLACLATIVVVMGSVAVVERMVIFGAAALGYVLLAGFLVLLTRSETKLLGEKALDRLIVLVLFAFTAIAYLPVSLLIPLILMGIYAIYVMRRDDSSRPSVGMICLFLVVVVAWEVHWSWHTFRYSAGFLPSLWEQLLSLGFLRAVTTLGSANIGGALPLWATLIRFFWLAFLGIGTLVGLRNLLRIKRLSWAERLATGGLLGVMVITLIGLLAVWGGYQFQRFLMYAPLFSMPLLLLFLCRSRTLVRTGVALFALLIPGLVVPSFLTSENAVATDAIYAHEVSVGQFLEEHSRNEGESLIIYDYSGTATWAPYYTPNADQQHIEEQDFYEATDDELWRMLDETVASFVAEAPWLTQQKLFLVGDKTTVDFEHLRGISPDDPHWAELNGVLSGTNRIYDDGHTVLYASR